MHTSYSDDGFAHVVLIIFAVLLVGALGFAGYTAIQRNNTSKVATYSSVQSTVDTQIKKEAEIEKTQQADYAATSSDISSAATNLENTDAN